jgi:hypothetical protein
VPNSVVTPVITDTIENVTEKLDSTLQKSFVLGWAGIVLWALICVG